VTDETSPAALRGSVDLAISGAAFAKPVTTDSDDGTTTSRGEGLPTPARRRAPYPASPNVGPEGIRAAQEMIDAARRLFAERGYHATSVQAIAAATGRSDASFYQYFQGKHELFRIFVEELGVVVVEHFERLPALTDGEHGFARFRDWLASLGQILHSRSPVFVVWPLPDADEPAVENPSEPYLLQLTMLFDRQMTGADTAGLDSRALSIAVITLVEWAHVVLDAQRGRTEAPNPPDPIGGALHDTLAKMIHRALFPSPAPPRRADSRTTSPRLVVRPDLHLPPGEQQRPGSATHPPTEPGLRRPISRRSQPTIERLATAAVSAYERHGFAGTSVNDIAAVARVAHGTFYQYWTDRSAIFQTLAYRAAIQTCDHFDVLADVATVEDLREWLSGWFDIVDRYGTVLHIWTTEILENPPLWPLSRELRAYLEAIVARLQERWDAPPGLDPSLATVILWTLLTELPYNACRRQPVLGRDQVLNCQLLLVLRGLLGAHLDRTVS